MKRNLILGIVLIGAAALSSCSSTSQLSKSSIDDDVYYSKAKAGDKTEYINDPEYLAEQQGYGDDEYYYYGDYASRINRFGYYSPFGYGSSIYSPYSSRFSLGLGMGIGYGGYGGYGFDPYGSYYGAYGMGLGLGYGGYYGGYGYSPYYDLGYSPYFGYGGGWGFGYGYGGGYGYGIGYGGGYGAGFWGGGSTSQRSRPNYAGGNNPAVNRAIRSNLPSQNPSIRGTNGQGQSINSVNGSRNANGTGARPVRESSRAPQVERAPVQQSFGTSNAGGNSGSSGGGGNSGGGGGGGGGRPARP
jgi:hypothetical protein